MRVEVVDARAGVDQVLVGAEGMQQQLFDEGPCHVVDAAVLVLKVLSPEEAEVVYDGWLLMLWTAPP
jgi:hypothetical protein